ncbi:hypothetical protein [Maribellus sediminis]|uniref:hypothetical protein n=1 Tax=Maribellus sediminis TaxID=2696285 RepID=UPI00142F9354|nr:hypothetical protein [Maribellus sediminis]
MDRSKYKPEKEDLPHRLGNYLEVALLEKNYSKIPANVIIDKTLTGIGATYKELHENRPSIIIEPNVPVIKGKQEKYDDIDILGIYKGAVTTSQIDSFLKKKIKKKKILVTPESFWRIRSRAEKLNINIYKEYFCLFDECEKLTQESDFRKRIAQPVYDFFKFEKKAFVSATPLEMYHPELEKQKFQLLKVVPDYDYRVDIDVVVTNLFDREVTRRFNELLEAESRHICVFYNSTAGIANVIQKNREIIGDEYMVFASNDAEKQLHKLSITNVKTDFKQPLKKFNFFTSRFFSAFDIDIPHRKADILILTDLKTALHSIIDPRTEAVQIQGRFREPEPIKLGYWFNSLTHIHNYNEQLEVKSDKQLDTEITEYELTHQHLKERLAHATDLDSAKAIDKELKSVKFAYYLDETDEINYFVVDNAYNEERVKRYYKSKLGLFKEYDREDSFFKPRLIDRVDLYNLEVLTQSIAGLGVAKQIKMIVEWISQAEDVQKLKENLLPIFEHTHTVFTAYKKLGIEVIERYKYDLKTIEKKLADWVAEESRFSSEIQEEIYLEFPLEQQITKADFAKRLTKIYRKYGVGRAAQERAKNYFECKESNGSPATFTLLAKISDIEQVVDKNLMDLKRKWLK